MNDLDEPFSSLATLAETPTRAADWSDVKRRSRGLVRRRRLLRSAAPALLALGAVLAATPALGVRGQVVRLFSDAQPASAPVVKDFAGLDVSAPAGMATGVIAGEARVAIERQLSTGKTAVLSIAPTQAGGFCLETSDGGGGGGGCDRDRTLRFAPGLSIPGVSKEGRLSPPVVFSGSTLIGGAEKVEIRFEDGTSAHTPVVWVSAPIDAGFFVYELPPEHWRAGHLPVTLVLENADGDELARDTLIAGGVRSVEEGRLEPSRSSG